jgi:hypothetical protein
MRRAQRYVPIRAGMLRRGAYDPDVMNAIAAQDSCRDYNLLFNCYMSECAFRESSRKVKLILKEKNTIVGKWPMRLKKNATQTEFKILHASSHTGSYRYVEWKREK